MASRSAVRSLSVLRSQSIRFLSLQAHLTKRSNVLKPLASQRRTYARQTPLTTEQYPNLKRDERFKMLDDKDLEFFRSALSNPETTVQTQDLEPYNVDWMNKYKGQSKLVLKPKSTKEVAEILKYCNEKKLAVVPQGGNTGLVGGGVPIFDEIILSTANLKSIRSFDDVSGVLVCDAGCILEELDNFLAEKGYMMPLDLGAKGSCHIGGNVATNAGGLRLLRYGSLHGSVLGIEAVLPNGTIVDNLSTLRKDNTGYDLKQLFIGSEGTIGIITGISILTPKRPNAINVALLGLESYDKVRETFQKSRKGLSEILSAFEFWDEHAFDLVRAHSSSERSSPLESEHPFYVLIETQGSNSEHDQMKLQQFLETVFEDGVVSDGVIAENETQKHNLWSYREGIPEACGKLGAVYKYDISLPLPVLYDMVNDMRKRLTEAGVVAESVDDDSKPVKKVVGYGHIGDGNVHLNIVASRYEPEVAQAIEPFVYEWTAKHHGSISAEHGLGLMKAPYVGYSKSKTMIQLMKNIKTMFDPNGILNPHKYI